MPERWLSSSSLMRKTQGFTSFSTGTCYVLTIGLLTMSTQLELCRPYACIGRNLAMVELQTGTAALVQQFRISFAPGEDRYKLLNGSLDAFMLFTGDVHLVFDAIMSE
ncbi:uncharacterized protein N7483_006347 [Penicillium malachiteum]|uniref:uncharacterized protein n=1 Tax=Penicillium malachiteum TaxID=1324776 RepID=UPI0025492904|nr:uncharacterized protein N7483_006347 [Penicillium malachiteum]KAJ5724990.1 hypothetical protein N7483_006347 [Penicillium malachiteum]